VTAEAASASQPQALPADPEPQRGQSGADQPKACDARRTAPVAASRVGQRGKQQAEQRAEKIFLVPDRLEDDQGHQRDVKEHHSSRPVNPCGIKRNTSGSQPLTFPLRTGRPSRPAALAMVTTSAWTL